MLNTEGESLRYFFMRRYILFETIKKIQFQKTIYRNRNHRKDQIEKQYKICGHSEELYTNTRK